MNVHMNYIVRIARTLIGHMTRCCMVREKLKFQYVHHSLTFALGGAGLRDYKSRVILLYLPKYNIASYVTFCHSEFTIL